MFTIDFHAEPLDNYVIDESINIHDYFSKIDHSDSDKIRKDLNSFILLRQNEILALDLNDNSLRAFFLTILHLAERFRLTSAFKLLYQHQIKYHITPESRLKATALFLLDSHSKDDYINRVRQIFQFLEDAHNHENESKESVMLTLVSFYIDYVKSFAEFDNQALSEIKKIIMDIKESNNFTFMNNEYLVKIFSCGGHNYSNLLNELTETEQRLIDQILHSNKEEADKNLIRCNNCYIEEGTEYAEIITNLIPSFETIFKYSSDKFKENKNDQVFKSLKRGIAELESEDQLYAYFFSYGKMHAAKLSDAYKSLPVISGEKKIQVVDWGCGQAIGTIIFFDYMNKRDPYFSIKSVFLIEPSEICLRRAALHVSLYKKAENIITINKRIDFVESFDLSLSAENIKVHLFANILDVEGFLLKKLIQLITNISPGINYFICVSPYICERRNNRFDLFVNHFSKLENYEQFYSIEQKQGEWINGWSRKSSVFKVVI